MNGRMLCLLLAGRISQQAGRSSRARPAGGPTAAGQQAGPACRLRPPAKNQMPRPAAPISSSRPRGPAAHDLAWASKKGVSITKSADADASPGGAAVSRTGRRAHLLFLLAFIFTNYNAHIPSTTHPEHIFALSSWLEQN